MARGQENEKGKVAEIAIFPFVVLSEYVVLYSNVTLTGLVF